MAAPTFAQRVLPTIESAANGPMKDGYRSLIVLGTNTNIAIWEKTGGPPVGVDGGEPIDCTTMFNGTWRTNRARQLKTLTPITFRGAFSVAAYNDIIRAVNLEQSITQYFSSGNYVCFYGYLQKMDGVEMEEGKQPEANFTIVPTNWDPVNNVEADPVIGTGVALA